MGRTSYVAGRTRARMQGTMHDNLQLATRGLESLTRAVDDLVGLSREVRTVPLQDMLGAFGLAGLPTPSLARARACRLPECACPPADLGVVRRVVDRNERVVVAVRLRNTTDRARDYVLDAGPMISHGGEAGGEAVVEPASVALDPGAVGVIRVLVDASKHRSGVDYETRLRIRSKGCDDLSLGIAVHVSAEVETAPLVDLHCCCTPKQRPLRWYHHYYCDPPAREAVDRPEASSPQRPVG